MTNAVDDSRMPELLEVRERDGRLGSGETVRRMTESAASTPGRPAHPDPKVKRCIRVGIRVVRFSGPLSAGTRLTPDQFHAEANGRSLLSRIELAPWRATTCATRRDAPDSFRYIEYHAVSRHRGVRAGVCVRIGGGSRHRHQRHQPTPPRGHNQCGRTRRNPACHNGRPEEFPPDGLSSGPVLMG